MLRRSRDRLAALAKAHPVGVAVIGLQTLAAAAAMAYTLAQQGQPIPIVGGERFTIKAEFADAAGLNPVKQPPVFVAGVPSGLLDGVDYDPKTGRAVATLELDSDVRGKIKADASAEIVPRSPLNILEVDIDPGSANAPELPENALIREGRTSGPTNLDRVTGVLDVDTRVYVQVLLDQLDVGLRGRSSSLRSALRELGPMLDSTGRVAAALADRRRLLSRLVSDLDTVFSVLGRRGDDLRDAITAGESTFGTVRRRQAELAETVRRLSPALRNTALAMDEFDRLSVPINRALALLRPFADRLPSGLRALRSFVPEGRGLFRDVNELSVEGLHPIRELRGLLAELGPASRELTPSVRRLHPILRAYDENGYGIGELGSNFTGNFSGQDAAANTLRAYAFFEPPRPENFGGTSGLALRRRLARAFERVCTDQQNAMACVARALTPGLPRLEPLPKWGQKP